MRFKHKEKDMGSRIVKLFLFFPVTIDNETRWLEWAYIMRQPFIGWIYDGWLDLRFVDDEEERKQYDGQ